MCKMNISQIQINKIEKKYIQIIKHLLKSVILYTDNCFLL